MKCARLWTAHAGLSARQPLWRGEKYDHRKIRVAYVSSDFRSHPVSFLLAGVFEEHDRERFETFAISLGPDDGSDMRRRLAAAFGRFEDIGTANDLDVAQLICNLEIDIAVDLMGHTADGRIDIMAHRPAPVQVGYLGYPGTIGAAHIDYIVADRFVIPDAARASYSEKVVYLPDTFQGNDLKRPRPGRIPDRSEAGLPERAFVFCCLNNSAKITPDIFALWMRLLQQADGSVLWLLGESADARRNLINEAENLGVDPTRLIFASRTSYSDYLVRLRLADVFLDTFPFNAGTTASDALWMGVPLITVCGDAFASRMAGSLLTAIGVPELIADSLPAYEALAQKLAADTARLASIRMKLDRNRLTHPVFDTRRFTRYLERAYIEMHKCGQAGLPPDHIHIE